MNENASPAADTPHNGAAPPASDRRWRLAEAKRQFEEYVSLGAFDPALKLHRNMQEAGQGWQIDVARLQPLVDHLRAEKRWAEATPLMVSLVEQLQQRVNLTRITLAQIAVKKTEQPDVALEALAVLDHRSLTAEQRDIVLEMQGRARRKKAESDITKGGSPQASTDAS